MEVICKMNIEFENNSFKRRVSTMLKVDFRRMITTKLIYLMAFICLVAPILILVMTTMLDGSVSINQQTGEETIMHGFDNVWQIFGSASNSSSSSMDILSMCNINLIYFGFAFFIGFFISADFRSGYAKNLFTVRSKKSDYVISKSIVLTVACFIMIMVFVLGSMIGGGIAGLSFETDSVTTFNIISCILSKAFVSMVFVPIYIAVSVAFKQRTWLAIIGSCIVGMLLFSMIPMITPLDSNFINVIICLVGGVVFSIGLGFLSKFILKKRII